ncbi:MAG TPA: FixH family protein [Ignavibacteria bacterium]
MKFNWGKGIILACGIFITMILVMVAITMTKNVDLVSPNYYEKEIKYQEEINKLKNTNNLKNQVKFFVAESEIVISFPSLSENSKIGGEIFFYRPSDLKKDFKMQVSPGKDFQQAIDISKIEKGLWKVKMNWNMDGIDYLNNTTFIKQ